MKPTKRTLAPAPSNTPPWDADGPAKVQTAISGSSIAAQMSNLQDLVGIQDQELAAMRELRCFARRLAGMPLEPDDDAPVPSIVSLAECAAVACVPRWNSAAACSTESVSRWGLHEHRQPHK